MFEHITITRQGALGAPIDLGSLAECLLFYEKVRVVSDVETFKYLIRSCGPAELLQLIDMGSLEIEFFENITGVVTVQTSIGELHELKTIQSHRLEYQRASRTFFEEWAGSSGKSASRLFQQFDRRVNKSAYTIEMLAQAQEDLLDAEYIRNAVHSILALLAPEYTPPNPFRFEVKTSLKGGSYFVDTNIDFVQADAAFQLHVPVNYGKLTQAFLLSHILETRRDLIVGSRSNSDFSLSPIRAAAAASKFAELLKSATKGVVAAASFQEDAIDGVPRIRDALNSGSRTFADVVRLVEQASQFKAWLKGQNSSDQLRRDYLREVSHLDWADKLPPKILRMLVMTGLGVGLGSVTTPIVGAVGALALNSADYFLIDKLVKGWRPNQFIEGPLRQFLSSDSR